MKKATFPFKRVRRTAPELWKTSAEKVLIKIRCTGCGHEKMVLVGKNYNHKASAGFPSTCRGTCYTGDNGSIYEFVSYVNKPQKTTRNT